MPSASAARAPLTVKLAFTGREQIRAVIAVILDAFEDLRYTEEVRGENAAFLVSRARVGGQDIETVDQMRLGPDGKIVESVFFRPLPATAAALRVIGAGLGRRRSRAMAAVISALARPLGFMTRAGDRASAKGNRTPCSARFIMFVGSRRVSFGARAAVPGMAGFRTAPGLPAGVSVMRQRAPITRSATTKRAKQDSY